MSQTSVGAGERRGGNESHGSDGRGNKTLGEQSTQVPPSGSPLEEAGPDAPAGVPGGQAHPGVRKGPQAYPDGPNVAPSPWEKDAAEGKLPK